MPLYKFQPDQIRTVGTQTVSIRERWFDDWEVVDFLYCNRATWCAAPSIPSAELEFRYGEALDANNKWATVFKRDGLNRYYVNIVFETQGLNGQPAVPLVWIGVLEVENDNQDGLRPAAIPKQLGELNYTAYGLESLLSEVYVNSSVFIQLGNWQTVDRGIPFNENRQPNMAPAWNRFHWTDSGARYWRTKDMVSYLLDVHVPRDHADAINIEWILDDPANALPNWDEQEIRTHGKSTLDLLHRLIARQRLTSFYVDVNVQNKVVIHPFSFADVPIALPGGGTINANNRKIDLSLEHDAGAQLTVKRSSLDRYDQVRVEGAQRTTVFTISYADGTIEAGWPAALELEYEAGATGAGDYPAASEVEERQFRDKEARSQERLREVYARYQLVGNWDRKAGGGVGDFVTHPLVPVGPEDNNPAVAYPIYPNPYHLLQTLPLQDGHDYTGNNIGAGTVSTFANGPYAQLKPFALFRRQDWEVGKERYRPADKAPSADLETRGLMDGHTWYARLSVPGDGSILLDVVNDDQYRIAKTDHNPLPEDRTIQSDWRDAVWTIGLAEDRFAEAVWPVNGAVGQDINRMYHVSAGDEFRLDYVTPNTVVGVDPETGELLRSDGGFVRDDRTELKDIAKLAYQWYGVTRRALEFETTHLNGDLEIGQLVENLGDPAAGFVLDDIRTCITEITVEWPGVLSDSGADDPPVPVVKYRTAFAELDVLGILGVDQ